MSEDFKKKVKSRKLIIAGILFATSTVLLVTGNAEFSGWSSFNQWVFGLYAAGNVGEHLKDAMKEK